METIVTTSLARSVERWWEMADRAELSIGMVLRHIRQEQRLTLREVERRGNIPHGYLGYVETGQRPPKLSLIRQVAEALRLSPEWTHVLVALAMQARLQAEVTEYVRVLATLPPLENEQPIGLSRGALEAFHAGWRTIDALAVLAALESGGAWRLDLEDPQGRGRVWWEFESMGTDSAIN